MEIFGIGMGELVLIFIIMLLVAGPKRMIRWSFLLGQYVGKAQKMWAEVAKSLQKELDDAGAGVKVPTSIPTRNTIQRDLARSLEGFAKPISEPLNTMKQEINEATMVQLDTKGVSDGKP
jgi:Sec-independent protein translocase protein TatA